MWDQYEVIKTLGEGSIGTVYKARQLLMDRLVAVKLLSTSVIFDETSLKRFQREAKIASGLDHPNIGKIYSFGIAPDERPFLVMELLEGKTLAQLLQESQRLSVGAFKNIFSQVCDSLQYAHDKGIVHRDIKPANIMLVRKDDSDSLSVKVLDFGIAKRIDDQSVTAALTQTGVAVGTPLYMSPEQCRGESCDRRSDIYSLGAVMYEALCGRPPFRSDTSAAVMLKHINEQPPEFVEIDATLKLPPSLIDLVKRCLSKNADSRPQTAAEVANALSAACDESPVKVRSSARSGGIFSLVGHKTFLLTISVITLAVTVALVSTVMQNVARSNKLAEQRRTLRRTWQRIDDLLARESAASQHGQYAELKKIFEETVQTIQKLPPVERASKRATESLFSANLWHAKGVLRLGGSPQDYHDSMRQAIACAVKAYGPKSEQVATAEYDLATYLADSGVSPTEAEHLADDLLQIRQDKFNSLMSRLNGDEVTLRRQQDALFVSETKLGSALSLLGFVKMKQERYKEARKALEKALEILRGSAGDDDSTTIWTMFRLTITLDKCEQFKQEDELLKELLHSFDQGATKTAPADRQWMLYSLDSMYKYRKDYKREKAVLDTLVRVSENDFGPNSPEAIRANQLLKTKQFYRMGKS